MEGQEADTDRGDGAAWDNATAGHSVLYIVRYANQGTEGLVYKRLEKFLQSGPRTGDFGDGGIY